GGGAAEWGGFGAPTPPGALGEHERGLRPRAAALDSEGFDDAGSGRLVESFARHLMAAFDAWHAQGFDEIARSYLPRLAPEKGARREIGDNGDLLVRRAGVDAVERRPLVPALARPSWLDPKTGGPRQ